MSFEERKRKLVEYLIRMGYLKSKEVIDAMLKVDRHLFVPEKYRDEAYEDRPLPIGYNQTISAPHMVALMTELLELKPEHKVLEIGTGSGYHACILACIAKRVITIERIPELAKKAEENIKRACFSNKIKIVIRDGTLGYKEEAPYDRILVTAGAKDIPKPLFEQLKIGGKMVIPIGERLSQDLFVIIKESEDKAKKISYGPCAFVPLIGKYGWKEEELMGNI